VSWLMLTRRTCAGSYLSTKTSEVEMSAEANKKLVLEFIDCLVKQDYDRLGALTETFDGSFFTIDDTREGYRQGQGLQNE
jgi:hypothetical protein